MSDSVYCHHCHTLAINAKGFPVLHVCDGMSRSEQVEALHRFATTHPDPVEAGKAARRLSDLMVHPFVRAFEKGLAMAEGHDILSHINFDDE